MPFTAILKDLTTRTGALGAVMLDWDGETVASHTEDPTIEMPLVGAHHGIVLSAIRDLSERHACFGEVTGVSISTDSSRILISPIKEGYCLVMVMDNRNPAGKVFMDAKKAVELIEEEMG